MTAPHTVPEWVLAIAIMTAAGFGLFRLILAPKELRRPPWDPQEGDRVRTRAAIPELGLVAGAPGTIRLRSVKDDIVWYVRYDHGPQAVPYCEEQLCDLEPL